MTDDKWQSLVEMAEQNFRNVKVSKEPLLADTPEGQVEQGTVDILEFNHQTDHFRIERENKPVVLEKKMMYSHRQGDTARSEYKFSETEFSHRLRVYKEVDFDEWEEVTLDKLGF